jgi:heme oxygenase (biliverdin-producing, ferredoxin)
MTLPNSLSVAMREGSAAEHREAENSEFVERLVAGELAAEGYVELLLRLRAVYAALESVGHLLRDDAVAGEFCDPALDRLDAINADIAFWDPDPPTIVSPATDEYVARILASAQWGGLYLAHHYTRYLGDLSGGQVIGRVLGRTFNLDGSGVDFYEFPEIPKPKPYKDEYRRRLDALGLSATEQQRVVDEVRVAFQLNRAIFEELADHLGQWQLVH